MVVQERQPPREGSGQALGPALDELLIDEVVRRVLQRTGRESVRDGVRQHRPPAPSLLREIAPEQLPDVPEDFRGRLLCERGQAWKLSLLARERLALEGVHERARLGREEEGVVGIVPLPEEPLEELVVREAGDVSERSTVSARAIAIRALPPDASAMVRASTWDRCG